MAGLISGLGLTIRAEAAQLVAFGGLWLLCRLIRPTRKLRRAELGLAFVALVIGFAIPIAPYAKVRGRIMPDKLKRLISYSDTGESETNPEMKAKSGYNTCTASSVPALIVRAIGRLAEEISAKLLR